MSAVNLNGMSSGTGSSFPLTGLESVTRALLNSYLIKGKPKVDMDHFTGSCVHHKIRYMTIAQAKDMAHYKRMISTDEYETLINLPMEHVATLREYVKRFAYQTTGCLLDSVK